MDETQVPELPAPKASLIDPAEGVLAEFPLRAAGTAFGRAPGTGEGYVVIGGDDRSISREALWIGHRKDHGWCAQRIGKNQLLRERDGEQREVPRTESWRVESGDRLLLRGNGGWYRLLLDLDTIPLLSPTETTEVADYAEVLRLDPRQRVLATALCASRLDAEAYPEDTTANKELATILHVAAGTIDARVHRLRGRVRDRTGLGSVSRGELADYLIGQGVITRADLVRIKR